MQKTDFHEFELFCRKSHFSAWMHKNHFFRASKNTNSVFSANKLIMRMWGHRCSKASFSVRKSCMKDVPFSWNYMFFAMQKTDFQEL